MANSTRNRTGIALFWLAGIAVVALIVVSIRSLTRQQTAVKVIHVSYQTLANTVATNGKVEPVEEYQAHAPAAGVIQKIYVSVGEHVNAGTPLVKMDDSEAKKQLAAAASSLSAARLALNDLVRGGTAEERSRFTSDTAAARLEQQQAAANLATVQQLNAKGSASAGEVALAEQRLKTANLTLSNALGRTTTRYGSEDRSAAEARVRDAQASVVAARTLLESVNIHSPISGSVYSIPVSAYDFVPAGDDLLDVADLNRIEVRAYFDEPEIGKLARGQAVKIVWDAKPNTTWHGHIDRAPTTVITYGTRNVGEAIISVDDARGDLLPNTNVTVTVTEMQRFNVLSIPREALHTEGTQNFVYRIVNNHLSRTPVQVGVINLISVEITGGLTASDTVVLGAATAGKELTDGLEVKQVQ